MIRYALINVVIPLILDFFIGMALAHADDVTPQNVLLVKTRRVRAKDKVVNVTGIMQEKGDMASMFVLACGVEIRFTFHVPYAQTNEFQQRVMAVIEEVCK